MTTLTHPSLIILVQQYQYKTIGTANLTAINQVMLLHFVIRKALENHFMYISNWVPCLPRHLEDTNVFITLFQKEQHCVHSITSGCIHRRDDTPYVRICAVSYQCSQWLYGVQTASRLHVDGRTADDFGLKQAH